MVNHIDPVKGVRLSPYAYTDTLTDRVLFTKDFRKKTNKILFWGYQDGTGDSIKLSISNYFKQYVYSKDFLSDSTQKSVNKIILSGNISLNISEIYKGHDFVEFHFPASSKDEGRDWQSIRLVYKTKGTKYYLIAIIRDVWTG